MIVIACGSRDWSDTAVVYGALDTLWRLNPNFTVIEGGAHGADRIAGSWAAKRRMRMVGWVRFNADWVNLPKWEAGPRRNQEMLDWLLAAGKTSLGVGAVVAFKDRFNWQLDKGGTEDMVRRAHHAGVPSLVVSHEGMKILR